MLPLPTTALIQHGRRCWLMFDILVNLAVNVAAVVIGTYIYDRWFK